ncbi:hypothetical protein GE300_10055 [Rhodobacteraceae bacterium 2CG4]|uniref:Component of SufBCD complex n=1 Tax=Halovulum marinum TaxID=2662447 RepID=A0A6L5Z088_9RHOB|nr:hypothetical protein [Halovulum marinum]MSU89951.1 hypothetical protein [Halovulum marinum]
MDIVREFMSPDSFWTLWFWIAHVVAWSMASHFAMGVPYDMIVEANRETAEDGPWARATEAMILAQAFRFTAMARRFGVAAAAAVAFLLSMLVTLGLHTDIEFARAVATILGPLTLIYVLTVRTAFRIEQTHARGAALRRMIRTQRLQNQMIGLMAIAIAVAVAVWEVMRNIVPI